MSRQVFWHSNFLQNLAKLLYMPSTFTWLDYSEHERRKMLDVIELFGEKTTRDELGRIARGAHR